MKNMLNIKNSIILVLCITIICMGIGFIVLSLELKSKQKEISIAKPPPQSMLVRWGLILSCDYRVENVTVVMSCNKFIEKCFYLEVLFCRQ